MFRRLMLVTGCAVFCLLLRSGGPAWAQEVNGLTWLNCAIQTVAHDGKVVKANDDASDIFVWSGKSGRLYFYKVTDTDRYLGDLTDGPVTTGATSITSKVSASPDAITWLLTWIGENGASWTLNSSINRVTLHYSSVENTQYTDGSGFSETDDDEGQCSIIRPQPLGLTQKPQF